MSAVGSHQADWSTTFVIVYCFLLKKSQFFILVYLFLAQLDSGHMRAQMHTSAQFQFVLYIYIYIYIYITNE